MVSRDLVGRPERGARRGGARTLVHLGRDRDLLYQRGVGPAGRPHYAVLVGWEPGRDRYILNDGRRAPVRIARDALMRRWHAAGGRALVLRRSAS